MREKIKKIFDSKTYKILSNIIKYIFLVFVSLFVILTVYQRVMPNESIFGYRSYVIISESMKPKYEIGDLILSKEIDPRNLKLKDDIVYYAESGEFQGKVITHEIIEIYKDIDHYEFTTKGIANLIEDDTKVKDSQIYGKVVYKFKIISLISKLVRHKYGSLFLILIPMFWIFILEFKELKNKLLNK